MRSFWQLFLVNVREWQRDPAALMWTLAVPFSLSLLIGITFYDESVNFRVGVANENGAAGESVIAALRANDSLDVQTGARSAELDALRDGERQAVVIVAAGGQTEVYYDPGHQNGALVFGAVQQSIAALGMAASGVSLPAVQPHPISAHEYRSLYYMLPGALALSLMQLGLFVTAPVVVGLRERQVLRRMFATPLHPVALLAAQVSFRMIMAVAQLGVVLAVGYLLFDMHVETRQVPGLVGLSLLGGAVFVTFGYVLAGLASGEETVQAMLILPNAFFMMLSGIFFPVDRMVKWLRPVSHLLPLTYLGDALRQQMTHAAPLYAMTTNVAVLLGWWALFSVLALRLFRWR